MCTLLHTGTPNNKSNACLTEVLDHKYILIIHSPDLINDNSLLGRCREKSERKLYHFILDYHFHSRYTIHDDRAFEDVRSFKVLSNGGHLTILSCNMYTSTYILTCLTSIRIGLISYLSNSCTVSQSIDHSFTRFNKR